MRLANIQTPRGNIAWRFSFSGRNNACRPDALCDPRHRILPRRHLDLPCNGHRAARRIVCASKRPFRPSPDFQHIKTTTRDPRD
ncbi:hypothetical protein [Burkholderia sp. BCCCDS17]|jgi:hypothetical protein|uniref:hypothetical protein n=1 Tax=Burkholderia sp. BCCCDS17 TaxID=3390244 RepID=UPI003D2F029B